ELAGDLRECHSLEPRVATVLVEHQRRLQRRGPESDDRGGAAPDHLVDERVVEERHATAADLLGVAQGPQTALLGERAQPLELRVGAGRTGTKVLLYRVDLLFDEAKNLVPYGAYRLGDLEHELSRVRPHEARRASWITSG